MQPVVRLSLLTDVVNASLQKLVGRRDQKGPCRATKQRNHYRITRSLSWK